jgi:hypothetical protein
MVSIGARGLAETRKVAFDCNYCSSVNKSACMANMTLLFNVILRGFPVFFSFNSRSSPAFLFLTILTVIWVRSLARRFVLIPRTNRQKSRGLSASNFLIALMSFSLVNELDFDQRSFCWSVCILSFFHDFQLVN